MLIPPALLVAGARLLFDWATKNSAPPSLAYHTYVIESGDVAAFLDQHPDAMLAHRAVETLKEQGYPESSLNLLTKNIAALRQKHPECSIFCADFQRA